jgi:hypothetical protein
MCRFPLLSAHDRHSEPGDVELRARNLLRSYVVPV